MKANMIADRVLVRVIPSEGKTKGGLVIPMQVHENAHQWRGEVLSVGRGIRSQVTGEYVKPYVKEGDVIVFLRAPQSGEQAALCIDLGNGDEELLVIREPHILTVLTDLPRDTGLVTVSGKPALVEQPS